MIAPTAQTLRLPAVFSEGMVLRSGRENPIWGWASPQAPVSVTFLGETRKTSADSSGRWHLDLPSAPAGGPHTLEVKSGEESIIRADVLAGEVWLCSGQSNMELAVAQSGNPEKEIAAGNYPEIRLLNIPRVASPEVQPDVSAAWQSCSSKTVADFSAVGYYFGRDIHEKRKVPIGLINSTWGGTVAEAWTDWRFLQSEPSLAEIVEPYRKLLGADSAEYRVRQSRLIAEWSKVERYQDPGNRGYFRGWAEMDSDDTDWRDFTAPNLWQEPDMHHRGAIWFRKRVAVPASWAGGDLVLSLGALHDFDITYFNGEKIGGLGKETPNAWMTPRVYRIPAALVRAGQDNLIAIRVFVEFDSGGFTGGGPLALSREGAPIESALRLEGAWKYHAEYAFDASVPVLAQNLSNPQNSPSHLFNSMIAPLAPYSLSGVIWYQGESNSGRPEQYKTLFPLLIKNWRATFATADLPFLFVLLANYQAVQTAPVEAGWGEIREAQLEALKLSHTGVASAIDVGDADDIHPKDKQTVGRRLALVAGALVYGEKIAYSGPVLTEVVKKGSRLQLHFCHVEGGLMTRDGGPLKGFAVRGRPDCQWVWGKAEVEDNVVILGHPDLLEIREARYAWASNPVGNLSNSSGLPALPFRIDLTRN